MGGGGGGVETDLLVSSPHTPPTLLDFFSIRVN